MRSKYRSLALYHAVNGSAVSRSKYRSLALYHAVSVGCAVSCSNYRLKSTVIQIDGAVLLSKYRSLALYHTVSTDISLSVYQAVNTDWKW